MRAELSTPSFHAQKKEQSSSDIQARSRAYYPTGFLSKGTVIQAKSVYFRSAVNACTTDLNKSEESQYSAILMQYIDNLDQVMDPNPEKADSFDEIDLKRLEKEPLKLLLICNALYYSNLRLDKKVALFLAFKQPSLDLEQCHLFKEEVLEDHQNELSFTHIIQFYQHVSHST